MVYCSASRDHYFSAILQCAPTLVQCCGKGYNMKTKEQSPSRIDSVIRRRDV